MASGQSQAEARVGADIYGVLQNVPYADDVPVSAPARGYPAFVQVLDDEPHAHPVPGVQPEDELHDGGLILDDLKGAVLAIAVAVGGSSESLAPERPVLHGHSDFLAAFSGRPGRTESDQRILKRVWHIVVLAGDLAAHVLQGQESARHRFKVAAQVCGVRHGHQELRAGISYVADQPFVFRVLAVVRWRQVAEDLHRLVEVDIAVVVEFGLEFFM